MVTHDTALPDVSRLVWIADGKFVDERSSDRLKA
jgi:hypothetical protein